MEKTTSHRPDDAELRRVRDAVAATGGRTMVRSEVLRWNRRWSEADREVLVRHLGRVGAVRFRGMADDDYVRCYDPQDRIAMVVARGYLTFPRHWVNDECAEDWPGIALSTLGVRAAATTASAPAAATPRVKRTPPAQPARRAPKPPSFCPRCFLQLTTTGTCPSCD